jgi:hypothetical protein
MPADQIRNRTVGCKMTDGEYERLSAVVESEGMTLGEWCREGCLSERTVASRASSKRRYWPRCWHYGQSFSTCTSWWRRARPSRRKECRRSSSGPTPGKRRRQQSGWRKECFARPVLAHPGLCLAPLADGVGRRQTQNVPIARSSARPESWQIVGKWVFEREACKQRK